MKPARLAFALGIVGLISLPTTVQAQHPTPDTNPARGTLPPEIPVFPLQDVMLFPNISRPLHIFEPRYRVMVADALRGDRIIGMVLLQPGHETEYEGRPPIYPIGCAGIITNVVELPDGRYDIVLRGLMKFRITNEDQSQAYRLARIESIPEVSADDERDALRMQRERLMSLLASIAPHLEPPPPELSDEDLVNGLAQHLDLDPLDRQGLLEREGPLARSKALIDLLEIEVALPLAGRHRRDLRTAPAY
jgi:Lon protease-like protein